MPGDIPKDREKRMLLGKYLEAFFSVINRIFQLNYNLYTDDDCKENSENWNGNLKRVVEGKNKQQALICVSRRLVNIVYGMLKNQTEYQEPER